MSTVPELKQPVTIEPCPRGGIAIVNADGTLPHLDTLLAKLNAPVAAAPVAPELTELLEVFCEAALALETLYHSDSTKKIEAIGPGLRGQINKAVKMGREYAQRHKTALCALTAPAHQAALGGTQTEKWIPVSERRPTLADADEFGRILWAWKSEGYNTIQYGLWNWSAPFVSASRMTPLAWTKPPSVAIKAAMVAGAGE